MCCSVARVESQLQYVCDSLHSLSETESHSGFLSHLLLTEFALDFLVVTGVVDDGPGQFRLDVRQPRTQTAHVLIQLLHGHQGLPQLLHPGEDTHHCGTNDSGLLLGSVLFVGQSSSFPSGLVKMGFCINLFIR